MRYHSLLRHHSLYKLHPTSKFPSHPSRINTRMSSSGAKKLTKPWADGPYPLIPGAKSGAAVGVKQTGAAAAAAEMTLAHNMYIRGVNSIHRQAKNVAAKGSKQDKIDFANYSYQWSLTVYHHHELEEKAIFPRIAKDSGVPDIMDGNVHEHEAFTEGLLKFQAYLDTVKTGEAELDGEKLVAMIEEIMPPLHEHLHNEIDTLLAMKKYEDKCDVLKIFKEEVGNAANMAMKEAKFRNEVFPMALLSHDNTFEEGAWAPFPPIPWIILAAVRWIFCRSYQHWWRFGPCTVHSIPQELPFA